MSIKVSIIIPIENAKSEYIQDTIQSALDQNYPNFELIVVGDLSSELISLIKHVDNIPLRFISCNGKPWTFSKNLGLNAASGDLICFLKPGDKFNPDKIKEHVSIRNNNPNIDLSYNNHVLADSNGNIWFQSCNSPDKNFIDNFLNFSINLSDIIFNKDWILRTVKFEEGLGSIGGDLDLLGQLALEDPNVCAINRVLNCNRFHSEFSSTDFDNELDGAVRVLDKFYSDQRCPKDIKSNRNRVIGKIYCFWAVVALFRFRTFTGQELIRKAIRLDRSILDDQAKKFLDMITLIGLPIGEEFEVLFQQLLDQLPQEFIWISQFHQITIALYYFHRGLSDVLWNRTQLAGMDFEKASSFELHINMPLLDMILQQISKYEGQFGFEVTQEAVRNLRKHLANIGMHKEARWLFGTYFINRAFKDYEFCNYDQVPNEILQAVYSRPTLFLNRGVLSILFHSYFKNVALF